MPGFASARQNLARLIVGGASACHRQQRIRPEILACWIMLMLVLAATARAALPETPLLRSYGVSDGLPSSTVNAIAQDSRGYLWLATDDGLARYDGVGFRVWRHDPADPASLPGDLVQALHVDAHDRVWVAMEGQGFALLDPDGVHFRQFNHANTPAMGEDDVFALASTRDGALWFGTFGGGLYRMAANGALVNYQPVKNNPRSLPDVNVLSLTVDARGDLWVATTAGAARWTGHAFQRVDAPGIRGTLVFAITAEPNGRLWFATKAGLSEREPDGKVQALQWSPDAADPRVTGILRDRDGGYWLSVPSLLRRRDPTITDGTAEAFGHPVAVPGTQRILGMLQDHEGSIWFATKNGGLAQLVPHALQFAGFRHDDENPASLSATQPEAMASAGDGRLWVVGGRSAIDRVDPVTGAIEHWAPPELEHRYLWALSQRDDGPLWVGYNTGIARIDPHTRKVQTWDQDSKVDAPLAGPNDLIAQTADGRVWISSLGEGIQVRDRNGRVLFAVTPGDGLGLTAPDTEQLAITPQNAVWLAGAQGLLAWNDAAHRFAPVPGAPADRVFDFVFADPHTLWLHRLAALERYGWDGHALHLQLRVDQHQGLPAVESGGVLADAHGDVWLTTVRGLLRFDARSGHVRVYGVRDGLPSQEFGRHPPLMTANGLVAAGTVDGLVLFEPSKIALNDTVPPLTIDTVAVRRGDHEVTLDPQAPIALGPDDRDLRVDARLLSYTEPKAHRYRYWLHGYDASWVEVPGAGERVFSRLDPGRYALEIEATNADGVWSAPQHLRIVARPPWWKTAIAYAVYAVFGLLTLSMLALLYQRRLKQLHAFALAEQQRELAEQTSEAKTRFLATMGHEIRTPMTGVLGMTELLLAGQLEARQRSYAESIQRAGQHLLRLVNDALDLARIEAGKLALDDAPFDLPALLHEVDDLLRPLAQHKGLTLQTELADDAPKGLRGDCARVRQILLNLGTNAIKFTERGSVRIRAVRDDANGGVHFAVVDTGPGLNAEQQARLFQRFEQADGARTSARYGGSGLGLAICEELAAAMGGRIVVSSTPGVGTNFLVSLPLQEAKPPLARSKSDDSQSTRMDRGPLRLLLVEDDPTIAEVLSGLLEVQGHDVVHAPHGLAALSELESAHFDAALLDLDLPGVNGLDLARLIRARNIAIPLLAVTARADADAESDTHAAGMQGFLRKPVTGEMLADAINALVPRIVERSAAPTNSC
jgi:signal transduction histidine kinase/ligand-binding sensor domain-containing protein/CheY-like chemotaxis protein